MKFTGIENKRYWDKTLERDFVEINGETYALNKHHVQFEGIHDKWAVYIKR